MKNNNKPGNTKTRGKRNDGLVVQSLSESSEKDQGIIDAIVECQFQSELVLVIDPSRLTRNCRPDHDGCFVLSTSGKEPINGWFRWIRRGEKVVRCLGDGVVEVEQDLRGRVYDLDEYRKYSFDQLEKMLVYELLGKEDVNARFLVPRARQLMGQIGNPWPTFDMDVADVLYSRMSEALLSHVDKRGKYANRFLALKKLSAAANDGLPYPKFKELREFVVANEGQPFWRKLAWVVFNKCRELFLPIGGMALTFAGGMNVGDLGGPRIGNGLLLASAGLGAWVCYKLYVNDPWWVLTYDLTRLSGIKLQLANAMSLLRVCSKGTDLPPLHPKAHLVEPVEVSAKVCEKKWVGSYGMFIEGAPIVAPMGCVHDQYNGLRIRFLFDRKENKEALKNFVSNSKKFIDQLPSGQWVNYNHEQWISRLPGPRRRLLESSPPITNWDKSSEVDIFVKQEVYVGKFPHNFKPRIIQGRQPELQNEIGSWFYSMSKYVASQFQNDIIYDCGLDALELGRLAQRCSAFKRLFEADVSNYDGSIHTLMLRLEIYYMSTFTNLPWWFKCLKKMWLRMVGRGKYGLRYKCNWGRRSGDMWTTLFNTLLNICITDYIFGHGNYFLVAKGDDNFGGTDSDLSESEIEAKYSELGMVVKIKFVPSVSELAYCSGRFYLQEDGWKWGVAPFRVLSKFGVNFHNHPKKSHKRLLKGTAISMLPIAGHVPLLGTLFRALANDEGSPILAKVEDWQNTSVRVDEVTDHSVMRFCSENGWSFEDYLAVERAFSKLRLEDFPILLTDNLFKQGFANETQVFGVSLDVYDVALKDVGNDMPSGSLCDRLPDIKIWKDLFSRNLGSPTVGERVGLFAFCFTGLLSPVLEEWLRNWSPFCGVVIGLFETFVSGNPYNVIVHTCFSVASWMGVGFLPLTVVHLGHNAYVYWTIYHRNDHPPIA